MDVEYNQINQDFPNFNELKTHFNTYNTELIRFVNNNKSITTISDIDNTGKNDMVISKTLNASKVWIGPGQLDSLFLTTYNDSISGAHISIFSNTWDIDHLIHITIYCYDGSQIIDCSNYFTLGFINDNVVFNEILMNYIPGAEFDYKSKVSGKKNCNNYMNNKITFNLSQPDYTGSLTEDTIVNEILYSIQSSFQFEIERMILKKKENDLKQYMKIESKKIKIIPTNMLKNMVFDTYSQKLLDSIKEYQIIVCFLFRQHMKNDRIISELKKIHSDSDRESEEAIKNDNTKLVENIKSAVSSIKEKKQKYIDYLYKTKSKFDDAFIKQKEKEDEENKEKNKGTKRDKNGEEVNEMKGGNKNYKYKYLKYKKKYMALKN